MSVRIGILGAGSWGIALAALLSRNRHDVTLWEFRSDVAERLYRTRRNEDVLPDIDLPDAVSVTSDLVAAVAGKDVLVVSAPSHVVRDICEQLSPLLAQPVRVVSVVKGVENDTLMRMSEVLLACLPVLTPDHIAVLSGPSHAEEVARLVPTVVVAASTSIPHAEWVQALFMNEQFRVYASQDVTGVELGGALKNVIAIASGICDGAELGDNTKAALITRGLAEITRLGKALGADPQTFMGLAGIGDLVVTCMSRHSRNRFVGMEIGKGRSLDAVLQGMVMVAEGVRTTQSAYDLARRKNVEVPITAKVHEILFEGADPRQAVNDLMTRAPRSETWDGDS